jgi:hypothetical protein
MTLVDVREQIELEKARLRAMSSLQQQQGGK